MTILRRIFVAGGLLAGGMPALAQDAELPRDPMVDDPFLTNVLFHEFETSDAHGDPLSWNGQAWFGWDLDKLWLKTEGEVIDGDTEELELQALYGRAVTSFWDFQVGVRQDFEPSPDRTWGVIGFQGVAPYFFETDAALFVGEDGDTAFRFDAEYEMMFTQRLVLTPEFEANFYGQDIPEIGVGSGLSDIHAGLRLRYEFRREFAPYIGVTWAKQFGDTADYAVLAGEEDSHTNFVLGLRFWF